MNISVLIKAAVVYEKEVNFVKRIDFSCLAALNFNARGSLLSTCMHVIPSTKILFSNAKRCEEVDGSTVKRFF